MIILQMFHVRFGQYLLNLQSEALVIELSFLNLIPSILIRQKYYTTFFFKGTTHFQFHNNLQIKQKLLIKKSNYI